MGSRGVGDANCQCGLTANELRAVDAAFCPCNFLLNLAVDVGAVVELSYRHPGDRHLHAGVFG